MCGWGRIKSNGKFGSTNIWSGAPKRPRSKEQILHKWFVIQKHLGCLLLFLGWPDVPPIQGHPLSTGRDMADMSCRLLWASINSWAGRKRICYVVNTCNNQGVNPILVAIETRGCRFTHLGLFYSNSIWSYIRTDIIVGAPAEGRAATESISSSCVELRRTSIPDPLQGCIAWGHPICVFTCLPFVS